MGALPAGAGTGGHTASHALTSSLIFSSSPLSISTSLFRLSICTSLGTDGLQAQP